MGKIIISNYPFFASKKRIFLLLCCLVSLLIFQNTYAFVGSTAKVQEIETSQATLDSFDLIMSRIQAAQKSISATTVDNNISTYIPLLNADGSFTDVNYADRTVTYWSPVIHLDRLRFFVLGYTMPDSKYYQSEEIYNSIVNMLQLFYDKHPVSDNWYNNQIATPQRMGIMLILMRSGIKQVPSVLEANIIERMKVDGKRPDQPGSLGTGANKLDIATHWVYRGCLTKDESVLSFGASQIYYPIFLTVNEGMQHDYSYQQHGNQLNVGGYGHVFISGILNMSLYLDGTPYSLPVDKKEHLSKFVRNTFFSMIRGKYYLYNILGRGVSRRNETYQSGFWGILDKMMTIDPNNKEEYEVAIARLKGLESPSYGVKPENKQFWRSDYTLHQRPGFAFDVRTVSTYTCRNENGNGENIKGYFLADGANNIVINGDEYAEIFPVWDWSRIPGVTSPVMSSIPRPAAWGVYGKNNFAGTASDGKYGVSTYYLNDRDYYVNTAARKSWFFFDDEVVCLGSDITSTATQEINTTLNQCLLDGDVIVKNGEQELLVEKGSQLSYTNPSWILHDSIGYVFPKGGNVLLSNKVQSGSWYSINTNYANTPISKDVFKLWVNHGVKPTKSSYAYIVVPNKNSAAEMNAYSSDDIEILANTESVQAVRNKKLNILGLVFYKADRFTDGNITIEADRGCTVLLKNIGTSQVQAYVADPTRAQSAINLKAELPGIEGMRQLACSFPVHPDGYAGKTKEFVIDENTPMVSTVLDPQVVEYDYNYAVEDAWVRDGSTYEKVNNGSGTTLLVKKDNSGYTREAYVKFDLKTVNVSNYEKIYLALHVADANVSIAETQWQIGYVSDNSWSENTLTWVNKPVITKAVGLIPTAATGSRVMLDITEIIKQEIANNNLFLTFNISSTARGLDGKTDAQFYAKENGDQTKSPQLMLQKKQASPIVDFVVVEDAWVRNGAANASVNNGSATTLIVKNDNEGYARESFVKFDISKLSANQIDKAILRLNVSEANISIGTINWNINSVSTAWTESTLTWLNKPTTGSLITSVQGKATGSIVEFDVTSYVKDQYAKGNKVVAFVISGSAKGTDGKTDAQFFSKESSDASKHPVLSIQASDDITASMMTKSLSLDEIANRSVLVYPNPVMVGEFVKIQLPILSQSAAISVINMSGTVVLRTNQTEINTADLLPGVYVILVTDSKNKANNLYSKLIVK